MMTGLRNGILLALLVLLGATTLRATDEPLGESDRAAIRGVIGAQIEAFRADDGDRAFSFASPDIRRMFGDSATFMDMARSGYAPVYRPRTVAFGRLASREGRLVQTVRLIGPDGRRVNALYDMERQPDGSWRIAGCQLVAPHDESV